MKKSLLILALAVIFSGCTLLPTTTKTSDSYKLTNPSLTVITPSPTIINTQAPTPTTMTTPSPEITQATAVMKTTKGDITIELFPKSAPKTVANFIGLSKGTIEWTDPKTGQKVSGKPLYAGTIFHRVIEDFMIQGGDPMGTGMGGPGYKFEDEFDPTLNFSEPYMLAMANSGPATNGSQFFITVVPTTWLNNKHTIFGKVTKGKEVVDAIVGTQTSAGDKPTVDILLNSIEITEK
jgi:peptidyl-prolyl cis-trans isomerase A (cyclophilin A)